MVPATTGVVHMQEEREEWIDKIHGKEKKD